METIKERLLAFIEYLDISVRTFEGKCGLANGYVQSVKSISSEKLVSIHSAYPKLSILWLLFNEGEMLNEDTHTERNASKRKNGGNKFMVELEIDEDDVIKMRLKDGIFQLRQ